MQSTELADFSFTRAFIPISPSMSLYLPCSSADQPRKPRKLSPRTPLLSQRLPRSVVLLPQLMMNLPSPRRSAPQRKRRLLLPPALGPTLLLLLRNVLRQRARVLQMSMLALVNKRQTERLRAWSRSLPRKESERRLKQKPSRPMMISMLMMDPRRVLTSLPPLHKGTERSEA